MGDQHQRAGKFRQALFQHFQRRDIEIVGRLVQQQQVSGLQHQLGDEDAGPLAAGKVGDRMVELLAGEEELRGPGRRRESTRPVDD